MKENGGKYDGKTSDIFRFVTADAKPSFPVPFDGEENAQLREIDSVTDTCIPLHLRWRPAFDAVGYNVFVSTDSTFSDAGGTTVSNPIFQPTGLRQGIRYFWRADAVRSYGSVTTGDTWLFGSPVSYARVGRNEAEHAVRGALCFPEKELPVGWIIASNDSCTVGDHGPGYLCYEWKGPEGKYRISTAYLDEKSGHSWFGLYINDQLKDEWIASDDSGQMTVKPTDGIILSPGDEIRLEFRTDRNMRTRIDYLDIHPSECRE